MPRGATCSLTSKAITIVGGSTQRSAISPQSRQTAKPHNLVSTFPGEGQSRADGAAIARDGRVSTPRDNPRLEEGQSLGKTGTIVTAAAGAIFEHMSLI